uniref:Uncharacterized protein n=1 Tax=Arundo donax TaxID=35708 RepID=A0A0A9H4V8_ARUDO
MIPSLQKQRLGFTSQVSWDNMGCSNLLAAALLFMFFCLFSKEPIGVSVLCMSALCLHFVF